MQTKSDTKSDTNDTAPFISLEALALELVQGGQAAPAVVANVRCSCSSAKCDMSK
jgi:hypothetical protein